MKHFFAEHWQRLLILLFAALLIVLCFGVLMAGAE